MDPKALSDARALSQDAFKQATERFLAKRLTSVAYCQWVQTTAHLIPPLPSDTCEGEPDCGWHNGGPCRACKAKEAA